MCGAGNSFYHEFFYERNLNSKSLIGNYPQILSHFERFRVDVLCPGLWANKLSNYLFLIKKAQK